MNPIIAPLIALATSVCTLIGNAQAMSNVNQLKQAELDLSNETSKGDDADDGKIEALHEQIAVTLQAINAQYALTQKFANLPPDHPA